MLTEQELLQGDLDAMRVHLEIYHKELNQLNSGAYRLTEKINHLKRRAHEKGIELK